MTDRESPELAEVVRPDGRVIRCVFDDPVLAEPAHPVVLIAPPYGKTMRDMFVAATYLGANGFRTCRFDYIDHVGASDGEIFDFTVSSALEDLEVVVATVRRRYPAVPLGILSFSIGSRVALRVARRRRDLQCLVSCVGVVHLQDTIRRIVGRDLVDDQLRGALQDDCEVMGYVVSRGFIDDAVRAEWYSLERTREDVDACAAAIVNIYAEDDAWVQMGDIQQIMGGGDGAQRRVVVLRGASHRLETNPTATRAMLVAAVRSFTETLRGETVSTEEVRIPAFRELVERNRVERRLEACDYGRRTRAERRGGESDDAHS